MLMFQTTLFREYHFLEAALTNLVDVGKIFLMQSTTHNTWYTLRGGLCTLRSCWWEILGDQNLEEMQHSVSFWRKKHVMVLGFWCLCGMIELLFLCSTTVSPISPQLSFLKTLNLISQFWFFWKIILPP